jgi:hypothetical protein
MRLWRCFGGSRYAGKSYGSVWRKDGYERLMLDDMSRSEKARKAEPILQRSRKTMCGLLLHDEIAAAATTEIITMQYPD